MNKPRTHQADSLFEGLVRKPDGAYGASLNLVHSTVRGPEPPASSGPMRPVPIASRTARRLSEADAVVDRDTLKDAHSFDAIVEGDLTLRITDDWAADDDDETTAVFSRPSSVPPMPGAVPAARWAQRPPAMPPSHVGSNGGVPSLALPAPPSSRALPAPPSSSSRALPMPHSQAGAGWRAPPTAVGSHVAPALRVTQPPAGEHLSPSRLPALVASHAAPAMRALPAATVEGAAPVSSMRPALPASVSRASLAVTAAGSLRAMPMLPASPHALPPSPAVRGFALPPASLHAPVPSRMPRFPSEPTASLHVATPAAVSFRRGRWLPSLFSGVRGSNRYIMAAGILLLAAGPVAHWLRPREAKAVVVVTGAGTMPLDRFTLEVDGRQSCSSSPCSISLEPGMHALRAESKGYARYEQRIAVTPGSEVALHVALELAPPKAGGHASDAPRTRVEDGSAVGQERDPARGLVLAKPADSAVIAADRADSARPGAVAAAGPNSNAHAQRSVPVARSHPTAPEAKAAETSEGTCTLNLNSIPASNVLVDGRPYGSTPKVGLVVAAGSHTVMFAQPDGGPRESQTIVCKVGEAQTVAARLKGKS